MIGLALMWWHLPSDKAIAGSAGTHDAHQYLTELALDEDDALVDMTVEAFRDLPRSGRIVGVRRGSVVVSGADLDHWTLAAGDRLRSEEHTSELQSLMRISYAVFFLKKNTDIVRHGDPHASHAALTPLCTQLTSHSTL